MMCKAKRPSICQEEAASPWFKQTNTLTHLKSRMEPRNQTAQVMRQKPRVSAVKRQESDHTIQASFWDSDTKASEGVRM